MSKPVNQETTSDGIDAVEASQEQESSLNETQPTPDAGAEPLSAEPEVGGIPEKFRGKTHEDILRSYMELEKTVGRLGGEKSHREKENEELRQQIARQEQEAANLRATFERQQQIPPVQPQHFEQDPLADFDRAFEEDPRAAVKQYVQQAYAAAQQAPLRARLEAQALQAADFHQRQLKENPDYRELQPDMQKLAREYGDMLRPDAANSPRTIELLYKIARADRLPRYVEAEVKRKLSAVDLVKQEKRQAQAESSVDSAPGSVVSHDDMSAAELRKLLPHRDD